MTVHFVDRRPHVRRHAEALGLQALINQASRHRYRPIQQVRQPRKTRERWCTSYMTTPIPTQTAMAIAASELEDEPADVREERGRLARWMDAVTSANSAGVPF